MATKFTHYAAKSAIKTAKKFNGDVETYRADRAARHAKVMAKYEADKKRWKAENKMKWDIRMENLFFSMMEEVERRAAS